MSDRILGVLLIIGIVIALGVWNLSRLDRAEQDRHDRAVCEYTYGRDSDRCK
jgi:hypothetical protein